MTASNERKVSRTTTARAPEEVVEPKKSTKFTTTLAAYGDRLPIGVLDTEGRLHKDIVCKTWKTRDERELGKKLANETSMADHVPIVIANMCSRIGPHDFEKIDDVEKSVVIATMYMADVFYVYALLRAKTMGNRLALNIDCPRQGCGVRFPFVGDLASLDVVGVEIGRAHV